MHLVPFHCPQAGLKSNFVNILNLLHAALSWNSESFLRDVAAENERISISLWHSQADGDWAIAPCQAQT